MSLGYGDPLAFLALSSEDATVALAVILEADALENTRRTNYFEHLAATAPPGDDDEA